MTAAVVTTDSTVTCPHCSRTYAVQRQSPRGSGAAEAKTWQTIPEDIRSIVLVWLSHDDLRFAAHSKTALRARLGRHGLALTENGCSARVSEMLGCNLIHVSGREVRQTPTRTVSVPQYRLRIAYAERVINRGGRL